MRLYARLTWQVPDPLAFAAQLAARLGVAVEPVRGGAGAGLVAGGRLVRLGTCWLEVRPWVREGPMDDPRGPGRLLLEPVPDGEDALDGSTAAAEGLALHGLGWGTVELDRAEDELSMWVGPPVAGVDLADDQLLATARLRASGGLPGAWTVLLEPSSEGRAAAALARDGEGPIALYLRPAAGLDAWLEGAAARGTTTGPRRPGPFGDQVLLPGALTGPHLVVTEGRDPVSATPPAGTIAP
jgi:hypothetical protein